MTMKKISFILILASILIAGCSNNHNFTLKGEIENLPSDTILVYYQSPYNTIDTIFAKDGKFKYSIPADTVTIFSLLINENNELPVFAYKDGKAKISGTLDSILYEGKEDNLKMNEIFEMEKKMKKDTVGIEKWVESFSKNNPDSYTNIYLLNKYFIQRTNPDYNKIKTILSNLHGKVKDIPYVVSIQEVITQRAKNNNTAIRSISIPDKNGKFLAWNALRDKITLVSFWASWDRESREMLDSLSSMKKEIKNKDFQIIAVSLDNDKSQWISSLPQDTINFKQLCDFKSWESSFIKQNNIAKAPYTILLDKNIQIIASDIYGKGLKKKIEEIINKDKNDNKSKSSR